MARERSGRPLKLRRGQSSRHAPPCRRRATRDAKVQWASAASTGQPGRALASRPTPLGDGGAGAEREKRATITKAEGDKLAAENLAAAAAIMSGSPGAMQLRALQTIDGLGPNASNTVLLAVPVEFMEFARKAQPAT